MFDIVQSNPAMMNLWGLLEITQAKSYIKNLKKKIYH